MEFDFGFAKHRKSKTDYDATCLHDPDCLVYTSSDGPVYVCQMGDFHLLNAYAKMLRSVNGDITDEEIDTLTAMRMEINKRGLKEKTT